MNSPSSVLDKIKSFFSSEKKKIDIDQYENLEDVFGDYERFYNLEDLVYLEKFNVHAAFKYDVVKDILQNQKEIGVSTVHIDLNNVYFSEDETVHRKNKSAAVHHLSFLSKGVQYSDNEYTQKIFDFFIEKSPREETFDFVDYVIAPIVFINIMKEYGFIDFFEKFNPESPAFSLEHTIGEIKKFSADTPTLEKTISTYFEAGGKTPEKMQELISEIKKHSEVDEKDLPKFFTSMIFAGVESTISFLTSFFLVLLRDYPNLINKPNNQDELYNIANEVLRIYTPVPYIYRTVRKDTVYSGIDLKVGDTLAIFLGAANMDKNYFESPEEIKLGRSNTHLSFGRGDYACIGKYASFRLALNMVSYLSNYIDRIELVEKDPKYFILNGMLKTKLLLSLKA